MPKKENKVLKAKDVSKCIGCYSCMIACSTIVNKDFSLNKSAIKIKSSGGYQGRIVIDICRGCLHAGCTNVCPTAALEERIGGGILFTEEKCNGCKKCIDACIIGAIQFDEDGKKAIPCRQCGVCVTRCPHKILIMEAK